MISVCIPSHWRVMRYDHTMTFRTPVGLLPEYAELAARYNGVFSVKVVSEVISDGCYTANDITISYDVPYLTFASEGDYALFKLSCGGLV